MVGTTAFARQKPAEATKMLSTVLRSHMVPVSGVRYIAMLEWRVVDREDELEVLRIGL